VLGTVAAFACYLRLAETLPVSSDGASVALQAWDMLHGNPLLRGWQVADLSWYTTELPQYMLVELVRGLHADVVYIAAAMTYTLVVLLAALLSKGRATGRAALARVAITVGIMVAPQPPSLSNPIASGVRIFVSSPDHIGTTVPILICWLILDRARPRWYIPAVTMLLLAWSAVADPLVLYIGVLPLVLVCGVRVYHAVVVERRPLESQWYPLALAAGAVVAAVAAQLALHLIRAAGGFVLWPPETQFVGGGQLLPQSLGFGVEGLLLLAGADVMGQSLTAGTAILLLHLAGLVLAGTATVLAVRRFLRDQDMVNQVLVSAIVINVLAYVFSTNSTSAWNARDIAAVLPFSAVLAGRLLAERLVAARLAPVLAVVLAGYLAGLAYSVGQQPAPPHDQRLIAWLSAHHLHSGLSGYWEANEVTLATSNHIQIRPLAYPGLVRGRPNPGQPGSAVRLIPGNWEGKSAWYNPQRESANFVVLARSAPGLPAVLATFGPPARQYRVGQYLVLTWNKNLLADLG
jgi:hypothetical protein